MIRWCPFVLWFTIAVSSVGCSGLAQVDLGEVVLSGRDGWQHPERVIASLELREGDRVAEIGAGNGYWLPRLSQAVGPSGRVYAVEVDPALVENLERRVMDEGLTNVEVILGGLDDPRLKPASVDLAMTCLTYHHIEDRPAYFRRLQTSLSAQGRVAHLDDRPDAPAPVSWFQSAGHWTDPAEMDREMRAAGYVAAKSFDFLPAQAFSIYVPEASSLGSRR